MTVVGSQLSIFLFIYIYYLYIYYKETIGLFIEFLTLKHYKRKKKEAIFLCKKCPLLCHQFSQISSVESDSNENCSQ